MMSPQDVIEAAVMRAAVSRGFVSGDQVREVLLLREELRRGGREATTLQILGARYLDAAQREELTEVYLGIQRAAEAAPPPVPAGLDPLPAAPPPLPSFGDDPLTMGGMESSDELAIPELSLGASTMNLTRPPEADPDPIKEFLLLSSAELDEPEQRLAPSSAAASAAEGEGEGEGADADEHRSASGIWSWVRDRLSGR